MKFPNIPLCALCMWYNIAWAIEEICIHLLKNKIIQLNCLVHGIEFLNFRNLQFQMPIQFF